jgi:radical SAM protein with 4Fe4S-binding SPASM domain
VCHHRYVPHNCVWELTLKCNMRCLHCGSTAGQARPGELSPAECIDVADQLVALGCTRVTLIGGEVFLCRHWQDVAARLSGGGAKVNIITNGWMMGARQVDQIRRAGLANVGVSVDGLEANHDRIRRRTGSFARAMRSIGRLRREDISVGVVTSLLAFNVADLPFLYERLADEGVSVWQLQIANAMGSLADARPLLLEPSMVPHILEFVAMRRAEGRMAVHAGDDLGYYDQHELVIRSTPGSLAIWQGCQAGLRVVGIDSIGNVRGCESLYDDRYIEGNLRSQTLAEIWRRPSGFAYNRNFTPGDLTGACAGCDLGWLCRAGCRGLCYFATGRNHENPYCCYGQARRAGTALHITASPNEDETPGGPATCRGAAPLA